MKNKYKYGNIPFNELKPLKEVWTSTDRPFKSSNTQDFIKKDKHQTRYSNREIENDLGNDWKLRLKTWNGCDEVQINIGTLSLKDTIEFLLNSDSISRLTHTYVRLLAIHTLSNDKDRFKKYLTTTKGKPIIIYRTEVGEYVNNKNFIQLNELIESVLNEFNTMDYYVKEYSKVEEEYQVKRFLAQYKESFKWIKSIGAKDDNELESIVDNLLKTYHLTIDDAVDEVKVAITTNTMKTENTEPYKLHNILIYHINTKHRDKNFTPKQHDELSDALVSNFDYLGSYLRNCKLFPDEKKFNKWCGYHTFSESVSKRGRCEDNIDSIAESHYVDMIDLAMKEKTNRKIIEKLNYLLREENPLKVSFQSLSRYLRKYPQIHSNYYSVMLKYERKHGELTKDEIGLLTFHSVIGSLPTNFYVKWGKQWRKPMLDDIDNTNNKLSQILYDNLVLPTMSDGASWSWFDNIVEAMVYRHFPNQKDWSSFAMIDMLLGHSSFSGVTVKSLNDLILNYKWTDSDIRTLEHWLAKSIKVGVSNKVSPHRFVGGNMYYNTRKHNISSADLPIPDKLNKGVEQDCTLGIIYNECNVVSEDIKKLTDTTDWKNTFHSNMTNEDWINTITIQDIDKNPIYQLREKQLRTLVGKLHNV